MNKNQVEKLIEFVIDFILDNSEKFEGKDYIVKVYSNPTNGKIPVLFDLGDMPLEHLVYDYKKQERVEDCEGINRIKGIIRLGCDLENLRKIGYIDYSYNEDVTNKLLTALSKDNSS